MSNTYLYFICIFVHHLCVFIIEMADEADNQPSTSSGKPRELTFIHRNGGLVLLRAGHQYTKKRENKNGWSHWRCVNVKDCSGSLQIKVCFKNLPFLILSQLVFVIIYCYLCRMAIFPTRKVISASPMK